MPRCLQNPYYIWLDQASYFGSCVEKYMNCLNKFQKGFGHANRYLPVSNLLCLMVWKFVVLDCMTLVSSSSLALSTSQITNYKTIRHWFNLSKRLLTKFLTTVSPSVNLNPVLCVHSCCMIWIMIIWIMAHECHTMNPCLEWIHCFLWCTMIQAILNHKSWFESIQRNAHFLQTFDWEMLQTSINLEPRDWYLKIIFFSPWKSLKSDWFKFNKPGMIFNAFNANIKILPFAARL